MIKTKKIVAVTLVLALTLLFAGCVVALPVRGNGTIVDTEITLDGSFNRVVSQGSFDVILSNQPSDSILFQVDENVLPQIDLNVRIVGETLYLSTRSQNISPTVFRFYVGVNDLTGVSLTGSGSVRSNDIINADRFEASVSGSGDIRLEVDIVNNLDVAVAGSGQIVLTGAAEHLNVAIAGSGTANLRDLSAQNAAVAVSGSGRANVYAVNSLSAAVLGSGRIHYYGNPQNLNTNISGSGRITSGD